MHFLRWTFVLIHALAREKPGIATCAGCFISNETGLVGMCQHVSLEAVWIKEFLGTRHAFEYDFFGMNAVFVKFSNPPISKSPGTSRKRALNLRPVSLIQFHGLHSMRVLLVFCQLICAMHSAVHFNASKRALDDCMSVSSVPLQINLFIERPCTFRHWAFEFCFKRVC